MTLLSITYVSDSLIGRTECAATVARIVAAARDRNAVLGVTGALLFSGNRFAQTIEGDRAAADDLMARIDRDPRHHVRAVVERHPIDTRRFPGWSMAYSGDSVFVARAVARALSGTAASSRADVCRLLRMIHEFTVTRPGP